MLRQDDSYEFEVQPVREYFCASYLYETAATYAPPGVTSAPSGTREQRFDAMARNPYWTNVLRFYAGKFFSGELGGLYFRLAHLIGTDETDIRTRELAIMLLRDWVFKESPQVTAAVVKVAFDPLAMTTALRGFDSFAESSTISLPPDCGRQVLADLVLSELERDVLAPAARLLTGLLAANTGADVALRVHDQTRSAVGPERSAWLAILAAVALDSASLAPLVLGLIADDGAGASIQQSRAASILAVHPGLSRDVPTLANLVMAAILRDDPAPFYGVQRVGWMWVIMALTRTPNMRTGATASLGRRKWSLITAP